MSHLVLDIEVSTVISTLENGWDDTDKMHMACAVVYDVTNDSYQFYGDTELERVRCLEAIQKADRLTSYNGWMFDLPVICRINRENWANKQGGQAQEVLEKISDDVYARISRAADDHPLQKRQRGSMSLNGLSRLNLHKEKIGEAGDVAGLYRTGKLLRIAEYCLHDVRLTYQLMKHIDSKGKIGVQSNPVTVISVEQWKPRTG